MSNSATEEGQSSTVLNESAQTRTQSQWSRQCIGKFIEKYTYECFFIGTPLLIVGTFLYFNIPLHSDYLKILAFGAFIMIFIGGLFIWFPVFHLMSRDTYQSDMREEEPVCEPTPSPFVLRMKPPDYDSLVPPGPQDMPIAPPAYDDICQNLEQRPAFIQNRNNAVSIHAGTLAPIHQHGSHHLSIGNIHSQLINSQTVNSTGFRELQTGNSSNFHEFDTQRLLY